MSGFPNIGLSKLMSESGLNSFLSPKEYGYDVFNTSTYAILLSLATYVIYKGIKKVGIRIDQRLAVAVAPYVVFGSCLRVIKDAGIVSSYLFVTPSIYVLVASIFFSILAISYAIQRRFKIDYYKTMFIIGILILPFALAQLDYTNMRAGIITMSLIVPWIALFKFAKWTTVNKIVTMLHMFDATTTFVAMSFFGYYEQHILPTFFINMFGPISFVVLKLVLIVAVLQLIDRFSIDEKDKEFKPYIKMVIGILGAATGGRDFITLLAGI